MELPAHFNKRFHTYSHQQMGLVCWNYVLYCNAVQSSLIISASVTMALSCNGYFFNPWLFHYSYYSKLPCLCQSLTYWFSGYIRFSLHSPTVKFPWLYHCWQNSGQLTLVKVCCRGLKVVFTHVGFTCRRDVMTEYGMW